MKFTLNIDQLGWNRLANVAKLINTRLILVEGMRHA